MYIALDFNKKRVSIENSSRECEYFCPICGEKLIIRAIDSKSVRKHFAHKRNTICFDDFTHDMSEWHYNWQLKFPEDTREIVVEKNGIKHRADILINNTVIEFQHSPITSDEIKKRNEFYLACGYNMVWVFDANDKIKNEFGKSINPLECSNYDLVWKRKKSQFYDIMPNGVLVFLDYKISFVYTNREYNNIDVLILLKNVDEKFINFYDTTPNLIFHCNFLKQFGVSKEKVLSISEIFEKHKEYESIIKQQKRSQIVIFNHKRGRNWHL